jgi:hypothetical protein
VDLIEDYLTYVRETEPPYIFHRWSCISSIGALLGRSFYLPFGHFRVFPNLYIMFIGDAASRKSTAIKINKELIRRTDYDLFSADKTSKEKFLLDLEGITPDEGVPGEAAYDKATAENLWGTSNSFREPKEVFIVADEWNEFAGAGNLEFYTLLGNLWDWDNESRDYTYRLKNSKSVSIFQPTVSILGGNTPENFARAFPPEIIGQGFLSRMVLVHGVKSERQYTIPLKPSSEPTEKLVSSLRSIRTTTPAEATLSDRAYAMLDKLYRGWKEIDDVRFKSYSNRRFTQLLKLSLILTASRGLTEVVEDVVVAANTTLSASEVVMPRALGEFGKSKNSDVANKVMDVLGKTRKALGLKDIWKQVSNDLEKIDQLAGILQSLLQAEKVMLVTGKGWLPRVVPVEKQDFVDWGLLTEEERGYL